MKKRLPIINNPSEKVSSVFEEIEERRDYLFPQNGKIMSDRGVFLLVRKILWDGLDAFSALVREDIIDINIADSNGKTLLHHVASKLDDYNFDEKEVIRELAFNGIKKLIDLGIVVHQTDNKGKSAGQYVKQTKENDRFFEMIGEAQVKFAPALGPYNHTAHSKTSSNRPASVAAPAPTTATVIGITHPDQDSQRVNTATVIGITPPGQASQRVNTATVIGITPPGQASQRVNTAAVIGITPPGQASQRVNSATVTRTAPPSYSAINTGRNWQNRVSLEPLLKNPSHKPLSTSYGTALSYMTAGYSQEYYQREYAENYITKKFGIIGKDAEDIIDSMGRKKEKDFEEIRNILMTTKESVLNELFIEPENNRPNINNLKKFIDSPLLIGRPINVAHTMHR